MKNLFNRLTPIPAGLLDEIGFDGQHFSTLMEIFPCGVSIATDQTCQRIIHNPISAEFLRIAAWTSFSHSAEKPPNVKVFNNNQILEPKDMPIQRAAWLGEHVVGQELEYVWEDGVRRIGLCSARPLRDDIGTITGAIGTLEDITERKQMLEKLDKYSTKLEEHVFQRTKELQDRQDELEKRERRLQLIFNSSVAFMSIRRKKDGRYIEANSSWLNAMGYTREEVLGRTLEELNATVGEKTIGLKHFNEKSEQLNESYIRNKYGKVMRWLISLTDLEFNGEDCVLSTSIDITELRRFEEEMIRLERLNLIGEMAAGIVHEIRNPLTTTRGFLQMLETKRELADYKEYFNLMIKELDRGNSIITEFLTLAKNKSIDLKKNSLNSIILSLFPLLKADALHVGKTVIVELEDIQDLLLDQDEIRQFILNLVRNGIEAVEIGGTVTIKTYTDGERVTLAIQDNGKGIPAEIYEKLGTPFVTTKDKGTGLGLSVCYRIAEHHNGKLEVETSSSGTIFFLRFPLTVEHPS